MEASISWVICLKSLHWLGGKKSNFFEKSEFLSKSEFLVVNENFDLIKLLELRTKL